MNVNYRLFGTVLGCAISVQGLHKVNRTANVISDSRFYYSLTFTYHQCGYDVDICLFCGWVGGGTQNSC